MNPSVSLGPFSWERMISAVEAVRERALRATKALDQAGIPYAVIGGNAVAAWVVRVDKAAVRNTQDVDVLLRRADLPAAQRALEAVGFVYQETLGIAIFLDGPQGHVRNAIHVLFANEKVREEYAAPSPDVTESVTADDYRVLNLESLVRMKLTSFRRKDQMHILDLIDIGLIDSSWVGRFPPELAGRLQQLLDTPDG